MTAADEDRPDWWLHHGRERLGEAALRLLAALGSEPRFPADTEGVEMLLKRVAAGRPEEAIAFAVEAADELPRYGGTFATWVAPVGDGCLRLRYETGRLRSEAIVLRPDGTLGAFEAIEGFGVPESEWTEQARDDVALVDRRGQEAKAAIAEGERVRTEARMRFRPGDLLATRSAPPQDPDGPVVSFVALYATGLVVYYLVPRPPDEELEDEDPWADDPLWVASLPEIGISDDAGTTYEEVDIGHSEVNAPLLRSSQCFAPGVAPGAKRLRIEIEDVTVEIDVGK